MSVSSIAWHYHLNNPNPSSQDVIKEYANACGSISQLFTAMHCDFMAEQTKDLCSTLESISETPSKCDEYLSTIDHVGVLTATTKLTAQLAGMGTYLGFNVGGAISHHSDVLYKNRTGDKDKLVLTTYERYVSMHAQQQKAKDALLALLNQANPPAPRPKVKYVYDTIEAVRHGWTEANRPPEEHEEVAVFVEIMDDNKALTWQVDTASWNGTAWIGMLPYERVVYWRPLTFLPYPTKLEVETNE